MGKNTLAPVIVGVVSYGVGNASSIIRMYEVLGIDCRIVEKPRVIRECSHIVLPGVGHFGHAVSLLNEGGWDEALSQYALDLSRPILGLCLGAQLLGRSSEEGAAQGLGLLEVETVRMQSHLPIPNMGWRSVNFSPWFRRKHIDFLTERYYFSHSFEMTTSDSSIVIGTFEYDGERIAAVAKDNLVAAQFHPEKSHRFGKKLLAWFATQ